MVALDEFKWWVARTRCFVSGKRVLGIHWIGSLVGPRVSMDLVAKREVPALSWNWSLAFPPVASFFSVRSVTILSRFLLHFRNELKMLHYPSCRFLCRIIPNYYKGNATVHFIRCFLHLCNKASHLHCQHYEGLSRIFRTGRLEWELQMVQLSATRCNCIAVLWVLPP
jgi:hypothetical protein